MSRYDRQQYIDIAICDVDPITYPICQLKYDGIWCGADVAEDHNCQYYSRHGQRKLSELLPTTTPSGLYIGELMFGSEWAQEEGRLGKLFLFDLLETAQGDHRNEPYIDRYARLLWATQQKSAKWQAVVNYPTTQVLDIWEALVAAGHYEGLVFRNPANNWHQPVLRAKFELTEDLYITGFIEGEGRLRGTLGSLVASYSPVGIGPELLIGGGFTDKLRREIWQNKQETLGRCFTVTAKKKFKSGLLRHPNFKEWHKDK